MNWQTENRRCSGWLTQTLPARRYSDKRRFGLPDQLLASRKKKSFSRKTLKFHNANKLKII